MAGAFRSNVWDPPLILSQIVSMQGIFYVGLGVWIALMDFIIGTSRSLGHIFSYQELMFKETHGHLIMVAYVLNAATCAVGLWYVVRRTRQCLDYSATTHLFHLLACWVYNLSFPHTLSWWLINTVSIAFMTVLGEYLCMRTELQEIPLGGPRTDL